jgi:hypothetical protein
MLTFLLTILPENFWIIIMVFAGIGLMLGIISRQAAFGVLGTIVILALAIPFIDALFEDLPLWVLILLMIVFGFMFIRWTFNLFFGKRTTDHFAALILHDIFLLPFRFIRYLFRGGS